MVSTCAFERPKTLSVGSPATTSRKWPDSRCSVRSWRSVWLRVAVPIEHHEHRDQGQRHGDDDGREPVLGGDHGQHGERHDHGQHELWQVAGEVAVEGVHTPRGQGHELAGALAAEGGRGVGRDPLRQRGPQLGLDPGRAAIGGHVAVPGDRRPHHDDEEQRHQRAAQLPEVLPVGRGADDDHREQPGPGHDQDRGRRARARPTARGTRAPLGHGGAAWGPPGRSRDVRPAHGVGASSAGGDAGSAVQPRPRPPPGPCSTLGHRRHHPSWVMTPDPRPAVR